jgi:hypothetical protein
LAWFQCTSTFRRSQFGTNHLEHFVFVNRIAPLIRAGGRLITLSSSGHRFSNVDLDDPNFERTPYEPLRSLWPVEDCNSNGQLMLMGLCTGYLG